jgi:hypothetical protein
MALRRRQSVSTAHAAGEVICPITRLGKRSQGQRRRMRIVVALMLVGALAGCVAHPVGPARTSEGYERKAVTSARSALSAVQTTRLAAAAAGKDNLLGPYAVVLFSEQEDSLSGVQGTFNSIQPPNEQSDALRDELNTIMSSALDHVSAVRVSARRGELRTLHAVAGPLDADAQALARFISGHS